MKSRYPHLFSIRSGLIASFSLTVILFILLFYVVLVPLVSPPKTDPEIRIFSRTTFTVLTDTVTVGKPFNIELTGHKNFDISANVNTQLVCWINGAENTVPLGTTYSNIPVGDFAFKRTNVIPASLRVLPSDSCKIQSSGEYIFYQKDRSGELKAIPIKVSGSSNSFKLKAQ